MNFRTLDLNLLRVLDALLKNGSTVAAAKALGMSQPAVSAALSRLRTHLGDPILIRQGRSLHPTDYALAIRDPLRQSLEKLETLLAGNDHFDPLKSDLSFKLSASDFFAELLMPELADHLSRHAPLMRVQLVDLVPDNYLDTLGRYNIDIALIPKMDFPLWADHQQVLTSRFTIIAHKGNQRFARIGLHEGDDIPIDLFCDMGHILFSPEGNLKGMGDTALAAVGRSRRVVMTMPVFSGVYNAVANSDLIAMIPEQLARRVAPRLDLALYPPPMPVRRAQICMVWHRRSSHNPAHIWLRNQIAQLLQNKSSPPALSDQKKPS
ncbi:LysR family transcriptional regulator [Thalassovita sp.]|uniref:LysR family transcriptional regulator n=1 Tax=Thalassovita sp. TaxID=1979401 RepID=UPI002B2780DF|nr:LysR family transcriptional regulator [Thalassovita sp.]